MEPTNDELRDECRRLRELLAEQGRLLDLYRERDVTIAATGRLERIICFCAGLAVGFAVALFVA